MAIVLGTGLGAPGVAVSAASVAATLAKAADNVPGTVDARVLRTATKGPIVATGTLLDSSGSPSAGMVAALVFPGEKIARSLKAKDSMSLATLGSTTAAANGSFTLRADASRVPAGYWAAGKTVNLMLVGWNGERQGLWMTPADLSASSSPAAAVTIRLDQPLGAETQSIGASSAAPASADVGAIGQATVCPYTSAGTYVATTNIGESQPRYATSWFKVGTSHKLTLGAAVSGNGAYGTWKASGSYSTTTGFSLEWSPSTAIRVYQADILYGKYRNVCTLTYITQPIGPTSGNHTPGDVRRSWCGNGWIAPMSAGVTFTRSTQGGSHFSESGGVDAGGAIGIDLSVDSEYASDSSTSYKFPRNSYMCGSNNYPAKASRMSEYP
jgi:hypothetical protein